MKIQSVISIVDEVKPNTFSDETKLYWINIVEGYVAKEIHKTTFVPYPAVSGDTELLVPSPYSEMYEHYLKARIDLENKDYESYSVNIALYNAAFSDYSKYYTRNEEPATESTGIKNYW